MLIAYGQKYEFINKWKKEDMEKDFLKLPVDEKDQPDFLYMESYMKKVKRKANNSLKKIKFDFVKS